MELEIEPITLNISEDVREYLELRKSVSPEIGISIKREAYRMAELIIGRVNRGDDANVRINPLRTAPNLSDLNALLIRKWSEQTGVCMLCGGNLVTGNPNKMLQPSSDRIDSTNGAYDDENVWITHLACNLAKNKYSLEDFSDWLSVVRGDDSERDE